MSAVAPKRSLKSGSGHDVRFIACNSAVLQSTAKRVLANGVLLDRIAAQLVS